RRRCSNVFVTLRCFDSVSLCHSARQSSMRDAATTIIHAICFDSDCERNILPMTSRLKSQRTKARAIASATRAPLTRIRTFRTPAPGGACQKLLDYIQCCTISARRHLRQGGCGLRPGKSILTVAGGAFYKRAVETAGATLSIKTDWNGFFAARYAPHCGASVNPRRRGQYITAASE